MKIEVIVSRTVAIEVNDRIFDTLYTIHKASPNYTASAEQYEEAIALVEQALGIPAYDPNGINNEVVCAAYALDGVPIFEV